MSRFALNTSVSGPAVSRLSFGICRCPLMSVFSSFTHNAPSFPPKSACTDTISTRSSKITSFNVRDIPFLVCVWSMISVYEDKSFVNPNTSPIFVVNSFTAACTLELLIAAIQSIAKIATPAIFRLYSFNTLYFFLFHSLPALSTSFSSISPNSLEKSNSFFKSAPPVLTYGKVFCGSCTNLFSRIPLSLHAVLLFLLWNPDTNTSG